MNEKKDFCLTAINRLTGERERISGHLTKSKAESERARLVTIRPEKRPYIYPLVAEYPKQLNLFSNNLDV